MTAPQQTHSLASLMANLTVSTHEGEPEHRAAPAPEPPPASEPTAEALDGWGVEMAADAPVALPSVPPPSYDAHDETSDTLPPPPPEDAPKRGRGRPPGARNKPRDLHPANRGAAPAEPAEDGVDEALDPGFPVVRTGGVRLDVGLPPAPAPVTVNVQIPSMTTMEATVADLVTRQERLEDLIMHMAGRIDELTEVIKANTAGQAELAREIPMAIVQLADGLRGQLAGLPSAVVAEVKASAAKKVGA